jgi:ribonucleoside-diphosphate reductase alpha chain
MLNEKALKIFNMKYRATPTETWEQACWRVASHIASVEEKKDEYTKDFFELIYNKVFLPGGRILANSGTGIPNLMNCFVLPVEDSRQAIYGTLQNAAEIFAHGGGVGYNFSHVREEGANIKTTGGQASGPLSFMSLFDQTGEVIQQASRRGAQIGLLNISHPDIEHFINYKSNLNSRNRRLMEEYKHNLSSNGLDKKGIKYFKVLEKTLQDDQLTHFNISVVLTNDFMKAVVEDLDWNLISVLDGKIVKTLKAKDLFRRLAEQAHKSGDPGILFSDRVNKDNMVPYLGTIEATNPCLTGDTKIHTVYDGMKTFKELADNGKDILVFSWSPETKLPVVRMMRNPRLTRKNVEILEIEFDSGLKVKCTLDHNFYTFRGNKVQAKDLTVGQSIRAFSMSIHKNGHLRVHGWGKDNKAKHQYVSRLVWECFNGKISGHKSILHHKDFTTRNNNLDNLQLVTPEMHNSIHYSRRKARGFYRHNHKVISIKIAGFSDVYNGTVDETHTYIIADDNPIAGIASGIVSANCGEVPLLSYESCCLGSLNLLSFYDEETKNINIEFLEYAVRLAVRFLDNVQEVSIAPIEKINEMSKGLRRLGLGVLGWADLLAKLEIPYDSDEALELANNIAWFISFFSWLESIELAKERGAFKFYDAEKVNLEKPFKTLHLSKAKFDYESIKKFGFRNCAITSIAPTGTLSLLAGVNSGIEPFFALAYKRNITEGIGNTAKDSIIEVNPILLEKLDTLGLTESELKDVMEIVLKTGSLKDCQKIPDRVKSLFKSAHEISYQAHIGMQAVWQDHIDNSISKTINLSEDATVEDIENAFLLMWKIGLKGGTIFRNNSRSFQILNVGS